MEVIIELIGSAIIVVAEVVGLLVEMSVRLVNYLFRRKKRSRKDATETVSLLRDR